MSEIVPRRARNRDRWPIGRMTYIFHRPDLPTFDQLPSWCNRMGKIDRSACVEVRVSEVRRLALSVIVDGKVRSDGRGRTQLVSPLPRERSARSSQGRVASGVFNISARMVHELHRHRLPRELGGDLRTHRAHAMCPPTRDPNGPFVNRLPHNAPLPIPWDAGLEGNPNKGATRTKMIGLAYEWTQPLRIEKWVFPKRIRPAYYLICPGTFLRNRAPGEKSDTDPRLPPLSTVKAGRKATGCPQRALKLLLVQCTWEEARDVEIFETWLASIPMQVRRAHLDVITSVINRYGPIMFPRTLLCPRCLGVQYGNDPESARQSWRRKQGKPDARPLLRKPKAVDRARPGR